MVGATLITTHSGIVHQEPEAIPGCAPESLEALGAVGHVTQGSAPREPEAATRTGDLPRVESRPGSLRGNRSLRVSQSRHFRRVDDGHLVSRDSNVEPPGSMGRAVARLKRLLI